MAQLLTPQLLEAAFDSTFEASHGTRLRGGFEEPFYRAPRDGEAAEVRFTRDHLRSALHEVAHWCQAGPRRRQRDDFGYWYCPDGRTPEEQKRFFEVEVVPQAFERAFCEALGLDFSVSADNLKGDAGDLEAFAERVESRWRSFNREGFPTRAARWIRALQKLRSSLL